MLLKEPVLKKVKRTVTVRVSDEVFGCDQCRRVIERGSTLDVRVFNQDIETGYTTDGVAHYELCSWKCVLKFIQGIDCNYFIDLPMVYCDKKGRGSYGELIKLLSAKKKDGERKADTK